MDDDETVEEDDIVARDIVENFDELVESVLSVVVRADDTVEEDDVVGRETVEKLGKLVWVVSSVIVRAFSLRVWDQFSLL